MVFSKDAENSEMELKSKICRALPLEKTEIENSLACKFCGKSFVMKIALKSIWKKFIKKLLSIISCTKLIQSIS